MTRRPTIFGLVAGSCLAVSAAAHADDCADLMTGTLGGAAMPVSVTMTMQAPGGKPETSRSVFTGTQLYVQVGGQWRSMPMTAKDMIDQVHESDRGAKKICHRIGSDTVHGQAATVYTAHVEHQGSIDDNKVWIANLPKRVLKSDTQIAGGQHIMAEYDYDHVQPPEGVQ
ncbi:MAG TPA: hypothetical protein VGG10_06965 [Rhizomicrobium sp.]